MNKTIKNSLFSLAGAVTLLISMPASVMAQQPYQQPYYAPVPQAAAPAPRASMPAPYNYGYNPYNRPAPMPMPYGSPYAYGPRSFGPGSFNRPWSGNRGFGPRGFGPDRMPFESNFTPWSRRFWNEIGDGGDNPFRNMDEWMKPGDPKEGAAQMWDDLLNAPSEMGQMPGGWTAPSISVPNPIDVGDEFRNAAEDMPGEMRNQMDNIDIQTW